jgi:uracil-DNA glycosylase
MTKPLFFVGEAWGENESRTQAAFCGHSGLELLRMLNDAGQLQLTSADRGFINDFYKRGDPQSVNSIWHLHADEFYTTNVFNIHPPANRLEWFCGPKDGRLPGYPPLLPSRYVRAEFGAELDRLGDEILAIDPNLIVALGNCALWALCGRTGVSKLRGTTTLTTHLVSGFKLMPTYHPAAVLRQWELRPTTVIDLAKAGREAEFPDIRRPACEIWIEPTLEDIRAFTSTYIRSGRCDILSVDIETAGNRITCIGFAPNANCALVVPFDDPRTASGSYWATREDESEAWRLIADVLVDPGIGKLFQNGLYDIAFLWRAYGIGVMGATHDTMLLSHALQPESLKGLGYLGSIYTDFGPWKSDRKLETIGRDK